MVYLDELHAFVAQKKFFFEKICNVPGNARQFFIYLQISGMNFLNCVEM